MFTSHTLPANHNKVAIAGWRTARVIISLTSPNQSQRSRSSATANDVSSEVRRIAKCGMRNLREEPGDVSPLLFCALQLSFIKLLFHLRVLLFDHLLS